MFVSLFQLTVNIFDLFPNLNQVFIIETMKMKLPKPKQRSHFNPNRNLSLNLQLRVLSFNLEDLLRIKIDMKNVNLSFKAWTKTNM